MTKEEAKKALLDGKKVGHESWAKNEYIYFDFETMQVRLESDHVFDIFKGEPDDGWEIFEEKKTITLYRYMHADQKGESIEYSQWTTYNFKDWMYNMGWDDLKLLKTETKEVEL